MLPIVAGVLTALSFAIATLASARASRIAGAVPTLVGQMTVGMILVLPVAVAVTPLPPVPVETLVLATLAGAANVSGLLLVYAAYRVGAVGIISTIASTEGAIAAVVSVLAGQALAPGSGPALAIVAVGVVLAAAGGGRELEDGVPISRARSLRAAGLACGAAGLFGFGLFTTGHVSATLPPAWVVLPGRLVGAIALGLPMLALGRIRLPRAALPYVLVTGCAEVVGFASFAVGSRDDIALTSVLASMFAPVAAIAAFVLFRERLATRQIAGIVFVVVGVVILGWLTA
ncbi:MAG TPA: EamA family transporter [Candidatus Limnocylindrales bacterium]|nr:EamA family transporter [Candidatus Limnocylindrales bacterium]